LHREPSTGAFLHVDFHEVSANEEMHATLPVHTVGESVGAKFENGTIEMLHHTLNVKCFPKNLPEFISVDISNLHAGHAIHVKDLPLIEGVVFLDDAEAAVVACSEVRKAEVEAVPVEKVEVKATEGEKKEAEAVAK